MSSSKKESSKSSPSDEHHPTMFESAKHMVDSVTESMFGTSSVFGVLVEPHSELTHPNEQTKVDKQESPKHEEHHSTIFETGKKVADAVTESMFETSSVWGVLVEPHPELHEHHEHDDAHRESPDKPKPSSASEHPWNHLV